MKIYAMSDMHGCMEAFEEALSLINLDEEDTRLVLLGDYIHYGQDSYAVLDKVMDLIGEYGEDKVIALIGNHEYAVLKDGEGINDYNREEIGRRSDEEYKRWMKGLKYKYRVGDLIFVHAGIDESAGELWAAGTPDYMFCSKFPPQKGEFKYDGRRYTIIAGHVGTYSIAKKKSFHDIYYDKKSHIYIDGTANETGRINVLLADADEKRFYQVTKEGIKSLL